jgi:hypothetical protein
MRRKEERMNVLTKLRTAIEKKLFSDEYLLSEKAKWEQQLADAHNGEFEDNDGAIRDAVEELESINAALARRQVA